jgi:pyruvate/2-oxoglutarate dehydrogenase complex dihydrolipoamide dehydrogenase (E3) component
VSGRSFDVVVLGAGPAGEVAAGRLADRGLEVAIVEDRLVGGECSFWACMPSKALLRPGELAAEIRRVPGVPGADGELDAEAVLRRRDEVIHDLDDDAQLPWLDDRDISLFRGRGAIAGEREVEVGGQRLTARRAVIVATGSTPMVPPIDGLEDLGAWTNREATTAKRIPERLLVLGGGPVGVEMAQAYRSLGAEVALVESAPRLLAREEPFVSEQLAEAFQQRGVELHLGAKATAAGRDGEQVRLAVEGGDDLRGSELLVAIGRRPQTEGIGLERVGVEPGERGFLDVDGSLLVGGTDWLYAVGDVNGLAPLTHMGKYHARIAADAICGRGAVIDQRPGRPPQVVFTDPEIAGVGHTLESAREAGLEVRAVDVGTSANAGASFRGRNQPGTSQIVIDEDRRVIVGATFTGFETAELLQAATIAIAGEIPLERLWHAVPPFPSRNEIWLNLLESYGL